MCKTFLQKALTSQERRNRERNSSFETTTLFRLILTYVATVIH